MIVTPIILAGGGSRRMGRPKALLDFDGISCLALVLDTCLRSDATMPILVLGDRHREIRSAIPAGVPVQTVVNPDPAAGQTSSLKVGIEALSPEVDAFLIYPVDLPLVRVSTVTALILAATATRETEAGRRAMVIPTHAGRRGHPALVRRSLIGEFLALGDDEPAHVVARRDPQRVLEVPVEDDGVVLRLNTPEEYAAALVIYRAGRPTRVI